MPAPHSDLPSRRTALSLAAGSVLALAGRAADERAERANGRHGLPFLDPEAVPRWRHELVIPPMHEPVAPDAFEPGTAFHGTAPEYADQRYAYLRKVPPELYQVTMEAKDASIIYGKATKVWGYNGVSPGPTFAAGLHHPIVARFANRLPCETSVHWHGGHTPSHSDGYPIFYVLPGKDRDYFYPNTLPVDFLPGRADPPFDEPEGPSTMWYHDHADDITAHNAYRGLAGFYIHFDPDEAALIGREVLPESIYNRFDRGGEFLPAGKFRFRTGWIPHAEALYDIPIVLQDKKFLDAGGGRAELFFDPFNHDGQLGDVYVLNGRAYPTLTVRPAVYRFRLLNASMARFFDVRLSTGDPMLRIGKDSWLYPHPVEKESVFLGMANRADVIIDFSKYAGRTVYLENILEQADGRGPGNGDTQFTRGSGFGTRPRKAQPDPILEIRVEPFPAGQRARMQEQAYAMLARLREETLREFAPINPSAVEATRHFVFERRKGAWQINHLFFDAEVANAAPRLFGVERWILENKSGGWWHPIHIHLESHQQVRAEAKAREDDPGYTAFEVPPEDRFKTDTTILGPNTRIEILMKFRTFTGPFVFHCHNLNHEDMRMMFAFDPRVKGPLVGPVPIQRCYETPPFRIADLPEEGPR